MHNAHEQFSSDAQVAALTSDIVWLVEREVDLADGSIQGAAVGLQARNDLVNIGGKIQTG